MTSFFESKRLHSDRARELITGYDPQADGTAERTVGLMKALSARCLTTSGLPQEFWGYAVKYAARAGP